eukprot:5349565-Pyramimonas_sp.AAC.1
MHRYTLTTTLQQSFVDRLLINTPRLSQHYALAATQNTSLHPPAARRIALGLLIYHSSTI